MTKNEAIAALECGEKVAHNYFSPDEWIKLEHGQYVFEDGVKCSPEEFWQHRRATFWETGWQIIKP